MKLWGGRFTKEENQLVHNFNESLSFDQKFYKQDIRGSIAHVTMLAKQGIREIDDKWARRFVKERVVPPDRQNIGMIMRQLHMKKYSEFPILEYTSGRCCMDDFYLQEI